ncbi:SPOR domain-containing protein [uncultured Aquimonas sp.]|jgi:DedD protein|uniref:SPOR domain-containing protein n=1 Tax=uncultured Aquimonas sp. TaxID=385483 RepID=UPI000868BFD8|nr:SPOR domain-containing protein [uncultured Aquimonas sp.]ODU47885.1 MAG: hypothetical protein ABS96_02965 [Xanthomonadaceae bacterium SCN 69-123]
MDAALKQRLIGATVLVALAVIFLPMLVDGPETEREASAEQLSLDLPVRPDRPMETREIPLLPTPAPGAAPAQPAAADGAEVLAVVDTDAEQRVDALSGQPVGAGSDPNAHSTPASPNASSSSSSVAAAPATAPPAASSAAPSAPARSAASSSAASSSPAAAAASSPPPRPAATLPTATAGGSYAVNVGSYANVANAENLLNRLKNAGIAAYAESVSLDGRPVRRVRLGPYAQRAEAERARQAALAVQRDLPTSIINLDAGSSVPAPARPSATAGFAVQLGALRSEADANALRDRARGAGFTAFVERVNADAGTLWRVRVGPELDRASAERRRSELKSRLNVDGLVVSHP